MCAGASNQAPSPTPSMDAHGGEPHLASGRCCQWEGPTGLGLVAAFFLLDMPVVVIGTVLRIKPAHALFVLTTALGISVALSGLMRGDVRNRLLSVPVLLFFLLVVVLLWFRAYGS